MLAGERTLEKIEKTARLRPLDGPKRLGYPAPLARFSRHPGVVPRHFLCVMATLAAEIGRSELGAAELRARALHELERPIVIQARAVGILALERMADAEGKREHETLVAGLAYPRLEQPEHAPGFDTPFGERRRVGDTELVLENVRFCSVRPVSLEGLPVERSRGIRFAARLLELRR